MTAARYIYRQVADMWLGYLEEYPDYQTQGESLEELQENLRDLYQDLAGGLLPSVRRAGEIPVA